MTLKKIGGIAFCTGFVVPFLLEIVGRCLDAMGVDPGAWLSNVYTALWPAALVLFDAPDDWRGYMVLFLHGCG